MDAELNKKWAWLEISKIYTKDTLNVYVYVENIIKFKIIYGM